MTADFAYATWRFLLWSKDIPNLNTYNAIDGWVSRGILKPGEMPDKEEWEKRLHEWFKDPENERSFLKAQRIIAQTS